MKWFIYIILLANVGFFVWHFQATESSASRRQHANEQLEDGAVRMVMLKEYVDIQRQPSQEPEKWCYSLGPFKHQETARTIETELVQQGFPLVFRVDKEARKKGYWVFLDPAKDYNEARITAERLKKTHKIKDLFIVTTGEKKHAVSLGVFSRFELAYRRQDEIKKMGFNAQVKDVELPSKDYWLDWPREFEQPLPDNVLDRINNTEEKVSRVELGCKMN